MFFGDCKPAVVLSVGCQKTVSADGESVSRNGENPGKQHQVTGKSIPLGGKSDIS